MTTTPTEATKAVARAHDETAWLIEETWSGYVHYVHRDFDAAAWRRERDSLGRLPFAWMPSGTGGATLTRRAERVTFVTKSDAEAMRFATKADADAWIAAQPAWISNTDQFQAREHMWPATLAAEKARPDLPVVTVPEGWALVPVEPIPQMAEAAVQTYLRENGGVEIAPYALYRAMLAAPPPPTLAPVALPGEDNGSSRDHAPSAGSALEGHTLPCDVQIGHIIFRQGVALSLLVDAAARWHKSASGGAVQKE